MTYATSVWGDRYTVSADFAQASCPVLFDGEGTQYQVADFRHRPEEAMEAYLLSVASHGGDDPDDESIRRDIAAAVKTMRRID